MPPEKKPEGGKNIAEGVGWRRGLVLIFNRSKKTVGSGVGSGEGKKKAAIGIGKGGEDGQGKGLDGAGERKGLGVGLIKSDFDRGIGETLAGKRGGRVGGGVGGIEGEGRRKDNGANTGAVRFGRWGRETDGSGATAIGIDGGETKFGGVVGKNNGGKFVVTVGLTVSLGVGVGSFELN